MFYYQLLGERWGGGGLVDKKYAAVFVSPHLDDAVLSCGGRIAKLAKDGKRILVVTVFSEGRRYQRRKEEDARAMKLLGVEWIHLGLTDAKFRPEVKEIFNRDYQDLKLGKVIEKLMVKKIKMVANWYFPLGLGGHVDHLILKRAGEGWGDGQVWFYEDYPYSTWVKSWQDFGGNTRLDRVEDIGDELETKRMAIRVYKSQIPKLFVFKPMYLSNREMFYVGSGGAGEKKILFLTDEITAGGARMANDNLIGSLVKAGTNLLVYEQVAPRFWGRLKVTRGWRWSIVDFMRRIYCAKGDGLIVSTSPNGLLAYAILRTLGVIDKRKLVYWCNSDRVGDKLNRSWGGKIYELGQRLGERLARMAVNLVVVPSEFYRKGLVGRFARVEVVSPGVDVGFWSGGRGGGSGGRVVVYCGRVDPIKGLDVLVEACLRLEEKVKLVILTFEVERNQGTYWRRIKSRLKNLDFEIIFNAGKEVGRRWFRRAGVVAIPSRLESFSLVLLEALAAGGVVAGSDTGEIGVMLEKIDKRFLIKNLTVENLTEVLELALNLEESERQSYVNKALKAVGGYTWENATGKIFKYIDSL